MNPDVLTILLVAFVLRLAQAYDDCLEASQQYKQHLTVLAPIPTVSA